MDRYISINNSKIFVKYIHVKESTDSPLLVFLHDALGCVASWRDFPSIICQRTGLNGLVYDRLGYGKSSPTKSNRSPGYLEKEALEVLPEVLKILSIDKVILVGHSDGGSMALINAGHCNNVQALVSIAAHIKVEDITIKGVAKAAPNLLKGSQLDKLNEYHHGKAAKLVNDWQEIWLSNDFRNWNISGTLSNIHCPALIIQGSEDEYATKYHAAEIVKGIGLNAELRMIKEAGHFPHKDAREEVVQLITDFISKLK